uniref:LIM zinc-binding domain-containing protein n=1 Tax=Electrophorus electricus TaxID=8005 RepID=A0A4W4H510_ELEEL
YINAYVSIYAVCVTSHIRVRAISLKRCVGCGHEISDQILLFVLDGYWHISCLKCSCCRAQLAEIGTSCFSKSGMVLCRKDYIRQLMPGDWFHCENGRLFCDHDRPIASESLTNDEKNNLKQLINQC